MANDGSDAPAQHESAANGLEGGTLTRGVPPFFSKVSYAAQIFSIQSFLTSALWVRGLKEFFYPPVGGPNIVKTYECRPHLPIR